MITIERGMASPPAQGSFDYSGWDVAVADEGRAIVARVRQRTEAFVIDTGRDLISLKAKLEHGQFLKWLDAELGFTPRTSQRYMSAAERFADKSDTVSYLPPGLIYKLAADSTPDAVRDQIVGELSELAAPPSREHVQAIASRIDDAKDAAREEARLAKLTAEQRKKEAAAKKAAEARRARELEKERAEWAERAARKSADAARMAELIVMHMPPEAADELAALFVTAAVHEVPAAILRARGGQAPAEEEAA